jgi:hypothetical protein
MSGCHVAMALALPAPEIAWPIFVVLVLEWVVWPVAMQFLPNAPTLSCFLASFLSRHPATLLHPHSHLQDALHVAAHAYPYRDQVQSLNEAVA